MALNLDLRMSPPLIYFRAYMYNVHRAYFLQAKCQLEEFGYLLQMMIHIQVNSISKIRQWKKAMIWKVVEALTVPLNESEVTACVRGTA